MASDFIILAKSDGKSFFFALHFKYSNKIWLNWLH